MPEMISGQFGVICPCRAVEVSRQCLVQSRALVAAFIAIIRMICSETAHRLHTETADSSRPEGSIGQHPLAQVKLTTAFRRILHRPIPSKGGPEQFQGLAGVRHEP